MPRSFTTYPNRYIMANSVDVDVSIEEAIKILMNHKKAYTSTEEGLKWNKSVDMAIIALEKELYRRDR